MKRWASLISGIVVGVVLAGAGVFALFRLQPGQTSAAASSPTQPLSAAATFAPFVTEPAPWGQPPLPDPSPEAAGTPARPLSEAAGALPPRLSLQQPYQDLGFDFQSTRLGDGRERWIAAAPDGLALVVLVGGDTPEAVSVTVFGSLQPNDPGGPQRTVYLLTLLVTVLPGWPEGAAWLSDGLLAAGRLPAEYTSEVIEQGLRVRLAVDPLLGEITLQVEPAG